MDYQLETTFDFKFSSRAFDTGIPTTLAGTPAVEIYEDNSITQITGAETLTVDFDGVTGFHNLRIAATAANGFEAGKSYAAVLSAGTVGGVSVVGETVCNFTIERGAPTAGAVADAVWEEAISDHSGTSASTAEALSLIPTTPMRGTDSAALASVCTESRLAELDAANVPAGVDNIITSTGATLADKLQGYFQLALRDDVGLETDRATELADINADEGSGAGTYSSNTHSAAAVEAACNAALVALHLDHLLAADYDPASKPGVATALLNELIESNGGVSRYTANALAQGPGGGDATAANQTTIISHLTDVKGAGWTDPGDTLESIKAALPASGGSGAFAVVVNVKDDGASNLENVTVRVQEGANTFVLTTDASGNVTFSLDAATYVVTLTKAGYQDDGNADLVIAGAGTENVTMTAATIPAAPADATLCTVYGYLETLENAAAAGVKIYMRLASPGGVKSNRILKKDPVVLVTDSAGDVITKDLQRNDLMTPAGTVYLVTCEECGMQNVQATLAAGTFDLATLIT